jgi:hypothetical protein
MEFPRYAEHATEKMKGFFHYPSQAELVDWGEAEKLLRRHWEEDLPPAKAAEKVFFEHVAPKLFFAGKPKEPTVKPGVQSEVTPEVRAFALNAVRALRKSPPGFISLMMKNFVNEVRIRSGRISLDQVKELVDRIHGFEKVSLNHRIATKLYAKQTAHDVIATKNIPTSDKVYFGCSHAAVTLAAALKALGVKQSYVRTIEDYRKALFQPSPEDLNMHRHSVVMFELGSKRYIADPWFNDIHAVTPEAQKRIEHIKSIGGVGKKEMAIWVEDRDSWGLGITDYKHFRKI